MQLLRFFLAIPRVKSIIDICSLQKNGSYIDEIFVKREISSAQMSLKK